MCQPYVLQWWVHQKFSGSNPVFWVYASEWAYLDSFKVYVSSQHYQRPWSQYSRSTKLSKGMTRSLMVSWTTVSQVSTRWVSIFQALLDHFLEEQCLTLWITEPHWIATCSLNWSLSFYLFISTVAETSLIEISNSN